ncbi:MAG: hypothetical protein R3C39_07835 [Dehalococcoidia bacterium]
MTTDAIAERFVIGLDDTDTPESGGTGKLARALVEAFLADGLGASLGVTRHQLLDHPKIPMTKRNSCNAIVVESPTSLNDIEDWAVRFVRRNAERGADPGVAILSRHSDMPHVLAFGRRCQQELMKLDDAGTFSSEANVRLRALGGKRNGSIGALAAVGLRAGGGDGRYVDLRGLRDLTGRMTAGQIREASEVQNILDEATGEPLDRDDMVDTGAWIRPRLVDGGPLLMTRRSAEERRLWIPVDRHDEKHDE